MRLFNNLTNLSKKNLAPGKGDVKLNSYFFLLSVGLFLSVGFNFSFSTGRSYSSLVYQVNDYKFCLLNTLYLCGNKLFHINDKL